jgi:aspartate carbamoyltransferase catalytic subunit
VRHLLSTENLSAETATAVLDTAAGLKRTLLGREVRKRSPANG